MNLSKCERCGCFFESKDCVCPRCISKDNNEISMLKNFLSEHDSKISISDLSINTGVSEKNVNRFLKDDKINSIFADLGLITNDGKISL